MRSKSPVTLIVFPVAAYLTVLLIGAFVARPSRLGWIGLGVVSVIVLIAAGVAFALFPRTRANGDRLHPRVTDVFRLLVVTDAHCRDEQLYRAVRTAVFGRLADILVVAPVIASPLHLVADDERREAEDARVRLTDVLQALGRHGIEARGVVGADDPLQAIGDALAFFPANQVLLVLSRRPAWLERKIERRVRDLYGVHVSTVIGEREPSIGAPR
jgi:hypothetical protein